MLMMFDCKISEISYVIYHNVFKTEIQGIDKVKMMLDMYENGDDYRTHDSIQTHNNNFSLQGMDKEGGEMLGEIFESEDDYRTQTDYNTNRQPPFLSAGRYVRMRSYRSVSVCLVLLCVLLLTAVIVLCVLINTNNHQCHNNSNNLTEERDQLLTKYTNITEEREQLLTKYTKLTEERDKILAKYNDITKQNEQLNQKKNELWAHLSEGWIYYKSSLYFISSESKSWSDSRSNCRERGADLIIINNRDEQDFISKKSGTDNFWIGLSDIEVEGRWKWVDGSRLSTSFWKATQPQGVEDENCVVNHLSVWSDYFCHVAFKFICEAKRLN
ncbi:uncharacterized protein [Paramisgurnus dabryanus]|uniref:uncharacterized protein n=1 Tax=Paramisgurnus dabryanus TaxID=90735 RepID=UPI003CCF4BEF